MLRLNKKSGFTLIEVLCAISIMSILSLFVVTVQLSNLRLAKYNRELITYVTVLEAIKEEMLNNLSYNDVVDLSNENKRFINKENLTLSILKTMAVEQIFSEACDFNNTYAQFHVIPGEVLKIELELHLKLQQKEDVIKYEFFKGNYL